jgi:hypothetical protein
VGFHIAVLMHCAEVTYGKVVAQISIERGLLQKSDRRREF